MGGPDAPADMTAEALGEGGGGQYDLHFLRDLQKALLIAKAIHHSESHPQLLRESADSIWAELQISSLMCLSAAEVQIRARLFVTDWWAGKTGVGSNELRYSAVEV